MGGARKDSIKIPEPNKEKAGGSQIAKAVRMTKAGRASIYKGTDKSTNKAGKVAVKKTSTKPVVYGNSNYKPTPKSKSMGSR